MKALVLILALLSFSLPALGSGMGGLCDQKNNSSLFSQTSGDSSSITRDHSRTGDR